MRNVAQIPHCDVECQSACLNHMGVYVCNEQRRTFTQVWSLQLTQNQNALYTTIPKSCLRYSHFDVKRARSRMTGHEEEKEEDHYSFTSMPGKEEKKKKFPPPPQHLGARRKSPWADLESSITEETALSDVPLQFSAVCLYFFPVC